MAASLKAIWCRCMFGFHESYFRCLKKYYPDEIYNLAGQSSVWLSFEQPVETFESVCVATLNLLEAMRFLEIPALLNLDMDRYIRYASDFDRPTDINVSVANTKKAEKELGWKANFFMKDVVRMMVEAELAQRN